MDKFLTIVATLIALCSSIYGMVISQNDEEPKSKLTLTDMLYRLDLVECSDAKPSENRYVAYKTYVYYNVFKMQHICCSWPLEEQTREIVLEDNGEVTFEIKDKYEEKSIQYFQYSCPNLGEVVELTTNLPPRVDVGDKKLCQDYLSIMFNNKTIYCGEFCGDTESTSGMNHCLLRHFKDILITFRSGYHTEPSNGSFKITIKCSPALLEEQEQCLSINPRLTTMEYLSAIRESFNWKMDGREQPTAKKMEMMTSIPLDAKTALLNFFYEYHFKASALAVGNNSEMLKLALLCEKSCDTSLSSIASEIVSFLSQREAIMEEELQFRIES